MLQNTKINGNSEKIFKYLLTKSSKNTDAEFTQHTYLSNAGDREVMVRSWVDSDTELISRLPAEDVEPFETIAPITKKMLRETNNITVTDRSVRFNQYRFQPVDALEVPIEYPMPNVMYRETIPITTEILDTLLQARYFVSTDELKPALEQIYCEVHDSIMEITATNGHVLYHRELPVDFTGTVNFFVQPNTLKQVYKLNRLDDMHTVRVGYQEQPDTGRFRHTHIQFQGKKNAVTGRVNDERYVDYRSVVPTEFSQEYLVPVDYLVSLTDLFHDTSRLRFDHGKVQPYYHDETPNYQTLPKALKHDLKPRIILDGSYLEKLKRLDTDEVVWNLGKSEISAMVFTGDAKTNEYMLLMPIRPA